jgi:hypothetical protein
MRKLATLAMLFTATFMLVGCDRDVMEVETPSGEEIEVEQDLGTGELEIDD